MATLEIVFLGLVAFAPHSSGKEVWVLMPATKSCPPCEESCEKDAYPDHYPIMAVPKTGGTTVRAFGAGCPLPYSDKSGQFVLYDLTGRDIRANWRPSPMTLPPEPEGNIPESAADANRYDWSARLSKFAPHLNDVRADCTNPTSWEACPLVTRWLLNRGKVTTECVLSRTPNPTSPCASHFGISGDDPAFRTFCFGNGDSPCAGRSEDYALAEGTKVTVDGLEKSIDLVLGGNCTIQIDLPSSDAISKIFLLNNASRDEIHIACSANRHSHERAFRFFYGLSASLPKPGNCSQSHFPFPQLACGDGSSPRCPQASFRE